MSGCLNNSPMLQVKLHNSSTGLELFPPNKFNMSHLNVLPQMPQGMRLTLSKYCDMEALNSSWACTEAGKPVPPDISWGGGGRGLLSRGAFVASAASHFFWQASTWMWRLRRVARGQTGSREKDRLSECWEMIS